MNHLDEVKKLRQRTDVHFNCAQSLLCPFAKAVGLTEQKAQALGNFFGSGMLHGSTCGALSGALMLLGMNGAGKEAALREIQDFRQRHAATDCAALLAMAKDKGLVKKEHCDALVLEMCEILDKKYFNEQPHNG